MLLSYVGGKPKRGHGSQAQSVQTTTGGMAGVWSRASTSLSTAEARRSTTPPTPISAHALLPSCRKRCFSSGSTHARALPCAPYSGPMSETNIAMTLSTSSADLNPFSLHKDSIAMVRTASKDAGSVWWAWW